MISFRYHVFTIVAIFLAVALGIAVGNAYVQPALVQSLRQQTDQLRSGLHEWQSKYDRVNAELGSLEQATNVLQMVDGGQLAGARVVVVTQDGTDPDVLDRAVSALKTAQADVVAVLSVTDRMLPADGQAAADLAGVLGLAPSTPPSDVATVAATTLADRLAVGPPRKGAHPGDDVLDTLLRRQYVRFAGPVVPERDLPQIGGRGEIVVALSGSADPLTLAPNDFMVPFVEATVARGGLIAAGEAVTNADPFVGVLRGDDALSGTTMVTVDDLGWAWGGVALVLGLEHAMTTGQGGDYGVNDGAEAPIPPVP